MTLANTARQLQSMGRHGDTMLAHISPEEALILKAYGGAGSRNPATGLPEFFAQGGDPEGGAVGHGPGPGHAEPGSGARGGGGRGGDGRSSRSRSRGMQAISNAVDQLGGATAETAKSVGRFGAYDDIGRWTARHGIEALANRANVSPAQMAQMLSAGRGSRPSQVGVGASLGQNITGVGMTPQAASAAVGISGPGFSSEAERVQAMGTARQTSRAAGYLDPTDVSDLTGGLQRIGEQMTPQNVRAAARQVQQMRATPGGTAPMIGNINVREPTLGPSVGFGDIPNPGQAGRALSGYATEIAQGIQDMLNSVPAPAQLSQAQYQGPFTMPGRPAMPAARPSPMMAQAGVQPLQSTPPPQMAMSAAPPDLPFADRGDRGNPPALAPPVRPAPSVAFPSTPAPAAPPPRQLPQVAGGTYGPYGPQLQRAFGLGAPTGRAFG